MDAKASNATRHRESARKLREIIFLPLLSCVRIDSLFSQAITFVLLRLCSGREQWIHDGSKVLPATGLKDDAPFATRTSEHLNYIKKTRSTRVGSRSTRGGISVTYQKDSFCLKGIAYTAEAA